MYITNEVILGTVLILAANRTLEIMLDFLSKLIGA